MWHTCDPAQWLWQSDQPLVDYTAMMAAVTHEVTDTGRSTGSGGQSGWRRKGAGQGHGTHSSTVAMVTTSVYYDNLSWHLYLLSCMFLSYTCHAVIMGVSVTVCCCHICFHDNHLLDINWTLACVAPLWVVVKNDLLITTNWSCWSDALMSCG